MRVRIYGPTGEIAGSPFDMENASGSTDWRGGVVFRKQVILPVRGMYSYRFVAHDGTGASYLPAVGRASGPKVNNAPVLSWAGTPGFTTGGVSPTSGPAGTWFSFQVKYRDADGDAPRWVQVRVYNADTGAEIAGSPFTMTNLSGTSDWLGGVIFGRLLSLSTPGNYKYRFVASDRLSTVYWPADKPVLGPTVTP
jgi:hypothetical protein